MDWIETTFGISPDGGNGTTEVLFVAAGLAIAALLISRIPSFRALFRRVFSWRS